MQHKAVGWNDEDTTVAPEQRLASLGVLHWAHIANVFY